MQRIRAEEVERLKSSCREARRLIAEMFVSTIVRPDDASALVAWGQYLDLRRKNLSQQYGIYGTSAGVQVLTMHEPIVYRGLIEAACMTLPLVATTVPDIAEPIHQYFRDKGDLNVVYKVAALADAVRPDLKSVPDSHATVEALLDLRTHGGGWGYFRRPELDEFQNPNVHATSTALLALGRFSVFRDSPEKAEALTWLARNVNTSSLSISTLSIILLALELLSDAENETPDLAGLRRNCRAVVTNWARRADAEDSKRTIEATEYLLPKPQAETPLDKYDHEFVFMLYLPHCLAALALIRMGNTRDRRVRRYIVSVVRTMAEHICAAHSFVAAGRNLESSVEHLWIYRLLKEFEEFEVYERIRDVVSDWIREALTRRRAAVTLTIILGLYGILNEFAPLAVALLVVPLIVTFMINIVSMRFYEDMFR